MNDIPPIPEPKLDDLRQLIGAPDLDEPLVSETAFADCDIRSSRPSWKMPIPKLMLIGGAMVPVFGLAGYFLIAGQTSSSQTGTTPEPDATIAASDPTAADLERAREEIAALKARMALNDQSYIQEERSPSKPINQPQSLPATSVVQPPTPSRPVALPTPIAVRSIPTPPTISYQPHSPQLRAASTPERSVQSRVDPTEQWQQLARLGSYGAIAPPERFSGEQLPTRAALPESSERSPATGNEVLIASAGAIPTAHVTATSAIEDRSRLSSNKPEIVPPLAVSIPEDVAGIENTELEPVDELTLPSTVIDTEDALEDVSPPILDDAEAAILESHPQMQSIIAGARASGHLETPVTLDEVANDDHFVVVLAEPLNDAYGQVAIPAESELLIQVDDVSDTGAVKLSATQVAWMQASGQRELALPEGVILVRGEDGQPLTARTLGDRGEAIAAMDAGQFVIGAIRRSAELYTRSDTRLQTNSDSTLITTENPDPNVLAGVLEGGTDAILDTISERNQRAIEELESRPEIAYIEAGRPVQVFVNQSMQLPM